MKVLAINSSPRKDGNTTILLQTVLEEAAKEGLETELIQLAGKVIPDCVACYKCFERKDRRCAQDKDPLNDILARILEADGLVLGSPTYFADVTSNLKSVIDRCGLVSKANGGLLTRKVGAAVSAVRRAGSIHTLATINNFFLGCDMIVPGSTYWNLTIGRNKGEVLQDAEGMQTMRRLGQNLAWLLQKIHA